MAPYFDQSGISIILRKPVRARSLFKFMEVYAMRWFWITDVSLIFLKFVKIIQLLNKFIKFLLNIGFEGRGMDGYSCGTCSDCSDVVVLGQIFSLLSSKQQGSPSLSLQVSHLYFHIIYISKIKQYRLSHLLDLFFREFTLKESFWFALTSFTPQGIIKRI